MKLKQKLFVALVALLCSLKPVTAGIVYSAMPSPIPTNVPSLGYEATSTSEFGQGVVLAGGATTLNAAQVLMSDWAMESTFEPVGTSTGYFVPLTLNLYGVGAGNTVGPLFASFASNPLILWRPEASPSCNGGFLAEGGCFNGLAQAVGFNLGNIPVPGQFIYGLAFNTTNHGAAPTGVPGPYDSLNFGLQGDGGTTVTPSVGSDIVANSAYWNTSFGPFYGDGGAGGVGTFRLDANDWQGFDPAVTFTSETTEPSTLGLVFSAGILLFIRLRGRKNPATR